jgi:HD-GYP domain-containing protein (c-di-GMP phosphodiesterase class II)
MSKKENAKYLAALKRFLRPNMVRELLAATVPLLPEGARLFLFYQGRALVPEGVSDAGLAPGAAEVASVPFALGRDRAAMVCVHVPGLDAPGGSGRDQAERVLELTAKSLAGMAELEGARRSLGAETLGKYRELAVLHRAIHSFNNTLRLRGITGALMADCQVEDIPAEAGMLFLRETFETGFEISDFFGPAGDLGLSAAPATALFSQSCSEGRGEIVNDLTGDGRWDAPGPGPRALLIQPVVSPNLCLGAIVLASSSEGRFTASHLRHLATISSVAGMAIENAFNFEGVQLLMDALLKALAAAIDSRDRFTSGHSERVARLGVALAKLVNREQTLAGVRFTEHELREIYYAGILHDVGKIGVREQVLTKDTRLPRELVDVIGLRMELLALAEGDCFEGDFARLRELNTAFMLSREDLEFIDRLAAKQCRIRGRGLSLLTGAERERLRIRHGNLTPAERLEIQRHPAESHRILRHIPFPEQFKNLLPIIHQHHERLDGSGYPVGEKSSGILIQSRILAIVDTYDAITQERHYKRAMSRRRALEVLVEEVELGRFDSGLVHLFCRHIDEIEREALVMEAKVWRDFGDEVRSH